MSKPQQEKSKKGVTQKVAIKNRAIKKVVDRQFFGGRWYHQVV